jgi:hypothetical protein
MNVRVANQLEEWQMLNVILIPGVCFLERVHGALCFTKHRSQVSITVVFSLEFGTCHATSWMLTSSACHSTSRDYNTRLQSEVCETPHVTASQPLLHNTS